jgi:hypothetical protein
LRLDADYFIKEPLSCDHQGEIDAGTIVESTLPKRDIAEGR